MRSSFNGARLKVARQYNTLTIGEVAERIGVSTQAVSQFENNKTEPKTENLFQIVNLLGFPKEFYFEEDKADIKVGATYFRSMASTSKKVQKSQIEKVKLLGTIYSCIGKFIDFPKFNLRCSSMSDLENLAQEVREQWELGDGPIPNIIDVMERNGVIISSTFEENDKIDAYSQVWMMGREAVPLVVLGHEKNFFRQQFNAAHELGHIITDGVYDIEEMSKLDYRNMENQMNYFAGALLIPKKKYLNDLCSRRRTDYQFYLELKRKYRVSAAALVVRANQLGAINANQYQYIMRQRSIKGYIKEEPYDNEIAAFKPRYLKQAMKMIIHDNKISGDEFMGELGISLSKSMVEKLLGLDEGYLGCNGKEAPIALFCN